MLFLCLSSLCVCGNILCFMKSFVSVLGWCCVFFWLFLDLNGKLVCLRSLVSRLRCLLLWKRFGRKVWCGCYRFLLLFLIVCFLKSGCRLKDLLNIVCIKRYMIDGSVFCLKVFFMIFFFVILVVVFYYDSEKYIEYCFDFLYV